MKRIFLLLALFLPLLLVAQVRPDQFPEESAPNAGNFEVYSQKNGVNKKASLAALRQYFAANIVSQIYPPPLSNNLESSRNKIVDVTSDGSIWYVDWAGYGIRLNTGMPLVNEIASVADTTEIIDPAPGDFALADDTLLIRGNGRWFTFFGRDGNGFKDGSGDLPNNTVATIPSYGNFDLASDAARLKIEGDVVELSGGESGNRWGMQSAPGTFIQGDISGNGARIEMDGNVLSAQGESFEVRSRSNNVGLKVDSNSVYIPDLVSAPVVGTDAVGKLIPASVDDADSDPTNELQTSETLPATPFGSITGTNIQAQVEETNARVDLIYGGVGNVILFSEEGDDATGIRGSLTATYESISGASGDYVNRDLLSFYPSTYAFANLPSTNFNVFTFPGVDFLQSGTTNFVELSGTDRTVRIAGKPNIIFNPIDVGYTTFSQSLYNTDISIDVNNWIDTISTTTGYNRYSFKAYDSNISFDAKTVNTFCGIAFLSIRGLNTRFTVQDYVYNKASDPLFRNEKAFLLTGPDTAVTKRSFATAEIGNFKLLQQSNGRYGVIFFGANAVSTQYNTDFSLKINSLQSEVLRAIPAASASTSALFNSVFFVSNSTDCVFDIEVSSVKGEFLTHVSKSFVKSSLNYNIGSYRGAYRLLNFSGASFSDTSTVNISCLDCIVNNDVFIHISTTSILSGSRINLIDSNIKGLASKPLIYSTSGLSISNTIFKSPNSIWVDSGATPITVNVCNTNLTRDKVGANVSLVYCEGQGVWNTQTFTATAAQTDFAVTGGKLPTASENVRVFNNLGARLRISDEYTYVAATGIVTLVTPAIAGDKITIEYFQ
jgi:hypothetical protein